METNELGSILHTVYLINPKLTIELNAKLKVTKALDEIRREQIFFFFRCDTKSMNYKGKKKNNLDKDTVKRMKRQTTDWEKYMCKDISN